MEKRRNFLTAALLAAAAILMAAGVAMEQNEQVFAKATRVCLECIGKKKKKKNVHSGCRGFFAECPYHGILYRKNL